MDEIEPRATRERPQHQPAFVERPAGDADLATLEVLEPVDGRIGGNHDGAQRGCVGRELQTAAKGALARNEHDVGQNHVRGAAHERDLAGLGRREFRHDKVKARLFGQAVRLDDIQFPRERAGLLRGDAQPLRRARLADLCQGDEHRHSQPAKPHVFLPVAFSSPAGCLPGATAIISIRAATSPPRLRAHVARSHQTPCRRNNK